MGFTKTKEAGTQSVLPDPDGDAVANALAMMSQLSAMKTLKDLDFESWMEWKTDLQIFLGLLDLDIALYKDKPTEASEFERWEKSNRLSLLIMKAKTYDGIRGLVHDSTGNAKQFFAALEDIFMKMEKEEAYSLFDKLLKMKYDGEGSVCEHIMKMSSIFSRCAEAEKLHHEIEIEDNDARDAFYEREQSGYTSDNDRRKRAKIQCFSCGEMGHKRWECPN
ncbi:hypothetical protein RGQ29_010218 [Quercus rubra]|uniref:CCHC-type domain-containing protein n=1 Tax=Quercus rubra TaxID=3512 RepID=A0AAN7G2G0_QUERU|nr:hypothetical protein RGQ29_010218 [Quercus rubra]